jgi:hypothetical protein
MEEMTQKEIIEIISRAVDDAVTKVIGYVSDTEPMRLHDNRADQGKGFEIPGYSIGIDIVVVKRG